MLRAWRAHDRRRFAVQRAAILGGLPGVRGPARKSTSEAQLMPVWVTQVEVTLAPRGIARREKRAKPGCGRARVHRVDIRDVEDHAPPTPRAIIALLLLQVEVLRAHGVARE